MSKVFKYLFVFLLVAILYCTLSSAIESEKITLEWKYSSDNILAVASGVIDNRTFLIAASSKIVYLFDNNGSIQDEYTINSEGRIQVIRVFDIDEDGRNEILLGGGWTETIDIDYKYAEDVDILYRKHITNGKLYIINDANIKTIDINEWIRSIDFQDMDGNGSSEIVVTSGGYVTNFFKKYTDIPHTEEYCWYESEDYYAGDYNETECPDACPTCWWNNETKNCMMTVYADEEVCETNITTIRGWNLSESSNKSGSIILLDKNLDIISEYNFDTVFLSSAISNIYRDINSEVVAGSENKIRFISNNGQIIDTIPISGEVWHIFPLDVNSDGNDEFVITFRGTSSDISGLMAVDRNGATLWEYRLSTGSEITDLDVEYKNPSSMSKIFLTTKEKVHVIDVWGNLLWSSDFVDGDKKLDSVDRIHVTDMGGDGISEIAVISNNILYLYKISESFTGKQDADKYYEFAENSFTMGDIDEAKNYLTKAREIYLRINDQEGLSNCNLLMEKIEGIEDADKKADADSHYARALSAFGYGDYETAREELEKAREIYFNIGDSDGILRCNSMISRIDSKLKTTSTTSISTSLTISTIPITTTTAGSDLTMQYSRYLLPFACIFTVPTILFLIVGFFTRMKKKKKMMLKKKKQKEEDKLKRAGKEEEEKEKEEKGKKQKKNKRRRT